MRNFERRVLTDRECCLARRVFGDELRLERVRLLQMPPAGFGAMVPIARTIVFSGWRAPYDFGAAGVQEQGWLIHELAHVWQAQRGVFLALAKLSALGSRAYTYEVRDDCALEAYNIEQQAEIARHLFLARAGAVGASLPARDFLEGVWPIRFAPSA